MLFSTTTLFHIASTELVRDFHRNLSTHPEKNPHSVVLLVDRTDGCIKSWTSNNNTPWWPSIFGAHVNWMSIWLYAGLLTAVVGLIALTLHSAHWSVLVLTVFHILVLLVFKFLLISGLFYIAFVWALISCRFYNLIFLFLGPRRRTETLNIADVGKTAEAACSAAYRPL